ncbi:UMP kinase [Candidatus Pacearchaeota archaeon]|nr:UMP kinase [Candidatus Pacearchaeota archaeon]|tara:strand:+ start:724 stop:1410 length:687 start_codon:yes stop_codon:yes gene_type:complete
MKKVIVVSLGGSLIIPDKIDVEFLESFKKVILKNVGKYKFVIVCGGGKTARNYINGLENQKISRKRYLQSFLGISATKLNARFMTYFFGKNSNKKIPKDMKGVKESLEKNNVVFCGALRYAGDQTSDSTSAKLARFLHSDFINMTNVDGLYDKNPRKFRSAKFIAEINHKDFLKMARKIEFHPGQHFVLDQTAAKIIKKYKIRTFILGSVKELNNLLNEGHFVGSIIG